MSSSSNSDPVFGSPLSVALFLIACVAGCLFVRFAVTEQQVLAAVCAAVGLATAVWEIVRIVSGPGR